MPHVVVRTIDMYTLLREGRPIAWKAVGMPAVESSRVSIVDAQGEGGSVLKRHKVVFAHLMHVNVTSPC